MAPNGLHSTSASLHHRDYGWLVIVAKLAVGGSVDRDFRAGVDGCRGVNGKVGADRSNN